MSANARFLAWEIVCDLAAVALVYAWGQLQLRAQRRAHARESAASAAKFNAELDALMARERMP